MTPLKTPLLGMVLVLSCAVLPGCAGERRPPAPEYLAGHPDARLVAVAHSVSFPAGSDRPTPAEVARLDAFLDGIALAPGDHVHLVQGSDDGLAGRRKAALERQLRALGLAAEPARRDFGLAVSPAQVAVVVERASVELPRCGLFPSSRVDSGANLPHEDFGCATARNLALQVVDPRDLVVGGALAPADGTLAAKAVADYRADKTKPLPSAARAVAAQAGDKSK
ncbi:CpaD family pilus assembly lipoprotein [Arenibaculum pallidiluteum]|uniref:CpaD family pilus assembly lipoprotein n=1 Tax=Arenibaculum pallidiluteum TaxID=2812559 RepID=UPI001A96FBD1|nr:CpaD family pilus assembly lipoprotein [Arenibaculum pallidiluteum]